jgi:hypothetical protein
MRSATGTKTLKQAILSQSYEGMEDAIDRGSTAACIAGFIVVASVWLGTLAWEVAPPAWQAIAYAAIVLARDPGADRLHASFDRLHTIGRAQSLLETTPHEMACLVALMAAAATPAVAEGFAITTARDQGEGHNASFDWAQAHEILVDII